MKIIEKKEVASYIKDYFKVVDIEEDEEGED